MMFSFKGALVNSRLACKVPDGHYVQSGDTQGALTNNLSTSTVIVNTIEAIILDSLTSKPQANCKEKLPEAQTLEAHSKIVSRQLMTINAL
jgi:hypothetical protein